MSTTIYACNSLAIAIECCVATAETRVIRWYFRPHGRTNATWARFDETGGSTLWYFDRQGSVLQFKRPLSINAGEYKCTAVDAAGEVITHIVTLEVGREYK